VITPRARVGGEDRVVLGALDDEPQPLLSLAQGLFGASLNADVARDGQEFFGGAVAAEDRRDDHVPVTRVALGGGL
jgi:hypothetical protein